MTYGTPIPFEPIASPVSLAVAARTVWTMWQETVCGRVDWLVLLTLFAGLQLGDIVTTNIGLGLPGHWEGNPLMAMAQTHLGALWWVRKAAAVFVVCFTAPFTRRRWFMILAVSYCTVTVSGNLLAL